MQRNRIADIFTFFYIFVFTLLLTTVLSQWDLPLRLLPDQLQVCREVELVRRRRTHRYSRWYTHAEDNIPVILPAERSVGCTQGTPTSGTENCRTSHCVSLRTWFKFLCYLTTISIPTWLSSSSVRLHWVPRKNEHLSMTSFLSMMLTSSA